MMQQFALVSSVTSTLKLTNSRMSFLTKHSIADTNVEVDLTLFFRMIEFTIRISITETKVVEFTCFDLFFLYIITGTVFFKYFNFTFKFLNSTINVFQLFRNKTVLLLKI